MQRNQPNRIKGRKPVKQKNKQNRLPQSKNQQPRVKQALAKEKQKVNVNRSSGYQFNLLNPEKALNMKVPNMFGQATVSLRRHQTVTIKTSSSGDCGFVILPQCLYDNTQAALKSVFFGSGWTNNATVAGVYNPITGSTGITIPTKYAVTPADLTHFRLTGASLKISPASNILNNSGQMGLSLVPLSATTAVTYATAAVAYDLLDNTAISAVENARFSAIAQINKGQSLRSIWVPNDNCDFEMMPINSSMGAVNLSDTTYAWAGYITGTTVSGAPASTTFNAEITTHYEALPTSSSTMTGMERVCLEKESASDVISRIKAEKGNVVHAI